MLIVTNSKNCKGKKLINMDFVHRIYVDSEKKGKNEYALRAELPDAQELLGNFPTMARCEEVMEDLAKVYALDIRNFDPPPAELPDGIDPFAFIPPKVYRMPEE